MNTPSATRTRARLALDPENARWLGVCAGFARWLDLPIALVRVVFVICVISWPTLLIAYLVAYFVLDRGLTRDNVQGYFRGAETAEHFRQLNYRKPIYRRPSRGRIAGVCAGLADYLEVKTFWVRLATLGSLFIFGPFTLLGYVICWIAIDVDPNDPPCTSRRSARREAPAQPHAEPSQQTRSYAQDEPCFNEEECTEVFRTLELRLREIEAYMTSKRFRLHCEINRI